MTARRTGTGIDFRFSSALSIYDVAGQVDIVRLLLLDYTSRHKEEFE